MDNTSSTVSHKSSGKGRIALNPPVGAFVVSTLKHSSAQAKLSVELGSKRLSASRYAVQILSNHNDSA